VKLKDFVHFIPDEYYNAELREYVFKKALEDLNMPFDPDFKLYYNDMVKVLSHVFTEEFSNKIIEDHTTDDAMASHPYAAQFFYKAIMEGKSVPEAIKEAKRRYLKKLLEAHFFLLLQILTRD